MKGKFKEFIENKLNENKINENTKSVSSNLLKNVIDVIKEFILTELELTEDQKMNITNNMEIAIETHNKGVGNNSPKFIIKSKYEGNEGKQINVQFSLDIIIDKMGKKENIETTEENQEPEENNQEE